MKRSFLEYGTYRVQTETANKPRYRELQYSIRNCRSQQRYGRHSGDPVDYDKAYF